MNSSAGELYSLFGLTPACSDERLRQRYRALLLQYHPDRNPKDVERGTRKTQELNAAYAALKRHREQDSNTGRIAPMTAAVTISVGAPFGVSLDLIRKLKKEFRDAWEYYSPRPHDVKAALRLVRVGLRAGRPDAVEDLLRNRQLIDAAAILFDIFPPHEADGLAMLWGDRLCSIGESALALQLLTDTFEVHNGGFPPPQGLKEKLRSIHYDFAQGYFSKGLKPKPEDRIEHLVAIISLGFELGYVYKLTAEAFHDLGQDDVARKHLAHALRIDPKLIGAKKIMKALGMTGSNEIPVKPKQGTAKRVRTTPDRVLFNEDSQRCRSFELEILRSRWESLSQEEKQSAIRGLWDALLCRQFVGEAHFVWALETLLKSTLEQTSPHGLLYGLHNLARVMEPVG